MDVSPTGQGTPGSTSAPTGSEQLSLPASSPGSEAVADSTESFEGLRGDDFKHPEYGSKLKNLYEGFQRKSKELKEYRDAHDVAAKQYAAAQAILNIPAVRKAARIAYGLDPDESSVATPEPEQETGESKESDPKRTKEDILADVRAEMALNDLYYQYGKGDRQQGRQIISQNVEAINSIMDEMSGAHGQQSMLAAAMELFEARKGKKNPPPAAASGTVATEGGRGTASGTPEPEPKDAYGYWLKALRDNGYASPADFAAASGAFGR